ncbi:hypothetical protein [Salinibacillus xinjiangensis]|uniref:Uncharacterized protein n=1 Tax=Salinibacillus xinjiangensis TaxID=1229268 RepID=A0A6G1X223_9BACI|nr:hypothetical protein [Salinibacillus xinjiangensis]MRG85047.1 hypothetical protein [Salinibacillus xinjiangensis]
MTQNGNRQIEEFKQIVTKLYRNGNEHGSTLQDVMTDLQRDLMKYINHNTQSGTVNNANVK